MCTLFYSADSHRKIVHYSHCKILKRIPRERRLSFNSLEEARTHGYRLCNCCPSIAAKYRRERKQVDDFCKANGFTFKLLDGTIHVFSKNDCWRIIVNGNKNNLFLYHKNTAMRCRRDTHKNIIPGFHSQTYRSKTILGYLKYIASHDAYRDEHPWTEGFTSPKDEKKEELPEWVFDKYGEEYTSFAVPAARRFRRGKKYRKEQAMKKRQERQAGVIRVHALLEELAVMGRS